MTLPRRQFVKLTFVITGAAVTGAIGALASACSSSDEGTKTLPTGNKDAAGGSDTSTPPAADAATDAPKDSPGVFACRSSISQNHNHSVTVPVTDLDSSSSKTYAIKGTADHSHDIILEAQDFADLKAGLSVKKTSDFAGQTHDHEVNILCATI
jgi:hypothetical protein